MKQEVDKDIEEKQEQQSPLPTLILLGDPELVSPTAVNTYRDIIIDKHWHDGEE